MSGRDRSGDDTGGGDTGGGEAGGGARGGDARGGDTARRGPPDKDGPGSRTTEPGAAGPGNGIVVSVRGVTVRRDGREILRDIDLDAPAGRLLAITGPSGSGKSTLLAVIAGLVRADSGVVTHDDRPPAPRGDPAARRVGLVLQGHALVAVLTARENVELALQIAGCTRKAIAARATTALAEVGLADTGHRLIEELSGGQQQRVAMARALCTDPDLLLTDEPTAELDPDTGVGVLALLRRRSREGGCTILIATHEAAVAASCDAVLSLDGGRLVQGGFSSRTGRRTPAAEHRPWDRSLNTGH